MFFVHFLYIFLMHLRTKIFINLITYDALQSMCYCLNIQFCTQINTKSTCAFADKNALNLLILTLRIKLDVNSTNYTA